MAWEVQIFGGIADLVRLVEFVYRSRVLPSCQEAASLRRAADRKEKEARDLLSSQEDQQKCDEQMKAFEPWLHFTMLILLFPLFFVNFP